MTRPTRKQLERALELACNKIRCAWCPLMGTLCDRKQHLCAGRIRHKLLSLAKAKGVKK